MDGYLKLLACALLLLLLCTPAVAEGESSNEATEATQAQPEAANEPAPVEAEKQPEPTPRDRLTQLELPDNPTREQCAAFIDAIRAIVPGNPRRESELVTKKLSTIPVKHIALLTQIVANNRALISDQNMYFCAIAAIQTYEPESYRKIAVDGLPENPGLILLIVQHGWYQSAKDPIRAKLEVTDPFTKDLPMIWFQAFVEVAEKQHYEQLHQMALNGRNLRRKLYLLDTLQGYDFAKTVNACWDNVKQIRKDKSFRYDDYVVMSYAIRNGNIDVLATVIDKLTKPFQGIANMNYYTRGDTAPTPEFLIRRHLDFRGTNQEIVDWFNTNRDSLVFDNATKRFQLLEDF